MFHDRKSGAIKQGAFRLESMDSLHTIANSYEEYKRLCEEKFSRNESPYQGEFISFYVDTTEKLYECTLAVEKDSNEVLLRYLTELRENLDKTATDGFGTFGKLVGLELTHEDCYYILEKEDGKRIFATCVGGLEYLDKQ